MSSQYPRSRHDLEVSHQKEGEREYVVVKDPRSRRYARMRPPEWWLLEQMNGRTSVTELARAFEVRFGAGLPPGSLDAFVERLDTLGFLEGERSEKTSTSLAARQAHEQGLGRLLFIKLKAIDPDRWLGIWAARLRFLFRSWIWPVSLLCIAGALVVVSANRGAFHFDLAAILQGSSIPLLVLSIFVVISLHEVAHGLVCRHLGGHVHEMGFLLLYFQPCLYCDLSDAWLFREKWKKLLVTFSGAYFQILLGALFVWGWRITEPGTWVNHGFRIAALVSLFNVLFNFNPLIKLDGYYLLSDGLGIPNLRTRAFRWLGHSLLGRPWTYAELPDRRDRRIYWVYGLAALVYSALLVAYIVHLTLGAVIERWRGPGLLLYLLVAAVMFRRPLGRAVRAVVPRPLYDVRKTIFWSLVGLAVLAALLVPFQYRVGSPARLEPWAEMIVWLEPDGYVRTEWYDRGRAELKHSTLAKLVSSDVATLNLQTAVSVGDSVVVGDTVLRIGADQFISFHSQAQAALRAKQAELNLLKSAPKPEEVGEAQARIREEEALLQQRRHDLERTQSLFDRNMVPRSTLEQAQTALDAQQARLETARQSLAVLQAPPKPQEVAKLEAEIERLSRQESFYGGQLAATVFTSPVPGRVLRLTNQGGELCRIARTDSVRCVMDVSEADAPLLRPGQPVTLKLRSEPFASYEGVMIYVASLGDTNGRSATFRAVAAVRNPGGLAPGTSGYAKVETGRHTVAWRAIRTVAKFVRIEFWSWW